MERKPFSRVVRSLMYTMVCTRLDIVQVLGMISTFMEKHEYLYWIIIKIIMRYLHSTMDFWICYEENKGNERKFWNLQGYVDAN